ncbi:MAG: hypothetical protein ACE5I1_25890 [bacterium]
MNSTKDNHSAISFVIAVNDQQVCRKNALASPDLYDGHQHQVIMHLGYASASLAYNDAIENAQHDLIVFIHQDIYLPKNWVKKLHATVHDLDATGRPWGVLGCYGVSVQGRPAGNIYSNGLNRALGGCHAPVPVQSLDETVLILRKNSGIHFDPGLPSFHLYGTDICMTAKQKGLASYAISNFCVHNSVAIKRLPAAFWQCAEYLRAKWQEKLPVKTCCVTLSPRRQRMWMSRFRAELDYYRGRRWNGQSRRLDDPQVAFS